MADRPIVIAGGGVGGLAAALALARQGLPATVLEQAAELGEIGAGIQLAPNAFHALDSLGVGELVRRVAIYIDGLVMMDSVDGEELVTVRTDEAFRARFGNPYAVVHRADLHGALLEGCRASPLVSLRTSCRVTGYRNHGDGVTVETAGGETMAAAALIGADGLLSKVREQVVGDGLPRVSGHISFRAVIPTEEMPEELRWNAATLWAGPNTHVVHYPLKGWKVFNLVATYHSDRRTPGAGEPASREEVMERFGHIHARPLSILKRPKEWRKWVLGDRDPVENWTDGRVTLLGDAAHPMLQYFAQGACMALEDAVSLSDRVATHGGDHEAAFRVYQAARLVRTARVQIGSRLVGEYVYHPAGGTRAVRNMTLRAMSQADLHDFFDWLYAGPDDAVRAAV
ncbi:MAG TPA: 3-hydroxybenzoate 6-monooxygenase [Afifellaceae bacterium]|nr:3-hydroxybenzoate 6-monooxygenase [Afifellaceae bacterium]